MLVEEHPHVDKGSVFLSGKWSSEKASHLPAAPCWLLVGLEDVGNDGEAKCSRLARSRLGTRHQVPPCQPDGNRVLLDWCGLCVVAANCVGCQCLGELGLLETADWVGHLVSGGLNLQGPAHTSSPMIWAPNHTKPIDAPATRRRCNEERAAHVMQNTHRTHLSGLRGPQPSHSEQCLVLAPQQLNVTHPCHI